jgi:uncharacterized protein (TIGR03066 family)
MRMILVCVAILALAYTASAAGQAKIDPKLLVGKWEIVPDKDKKEKPPAMVIEFTADGKVSLTVSDGGKESRVEGTYKLDADMLAVSLKISDKEVKETLMVKKLTTTELITEDSKKKTETLRKKQTA